jgi:hypothetical protein
MIETHRDPTETRIVRLEEGQERLREAICEIRDSVRSIEGAMSVLARVEVRHETILDNMTRTNSRLDRHSEMLEGLNPRVSVLESRTDGHDKAIWKAVALAGAVFLALAGALFKILLPG